MPHKIISKKQLSENVFTAEVEAGLIVRARKPGQFVIVSINNDYGERIPLTIAGADAEAGTIRLIWQRVGKTTAELADLKEGGKIASIVGPLGRPTHIEKFGTKAKCGDFEFMKAVYKDADSIYWLDMEVARIQRQG